MFPFELITLLVSTIVGGMLKLASIKAESAAREKDLLISLASKEGSLTQQARVHNDSGFLITRRFIAISSTIAIVLLPILAALLPMLVGWTWGAIIEPIPITFGYTQLDPGFWPFTSDVNVTKWYENAKGILITPFHTHLMAAISGLYFGTSIRR